MISALFWWEVSGVRSVSGRGGVLSVEAAVLISVLFWWGVSGVRSASGRGGVLSVEAAVSISVWRVRWEEVRR